MTSCQARVQDSVSSNINETNSELCNYPSVMESLQCYEQKNIELQRLLKQKGGENGHDYSLWNKQVVQSCEHLKFPPEETPQGEGLGLIKQQCYYAAYSARLKTISEKAIQSNSDALLDNSDKSTTELSKKNTINDKDWIFRTITLPIGSQMIDECNAAETEGRKVEKCKSIVPYWLSKNDENSVKKLLSVAKNSNAPIFEDNFAWVIPTQEGIVYLSVAVEESGNNWLLVSENSSGVSKYFEFGIGATFNIDKQMKVTTISVKKSKKIRQYQIEQDGSVRRLD